MCVNIAVNFEGGWNENLMGSGWREIRKDKVMIKFYCTRKFAWLK